MNTAEQVAAIRDQMLAEGAAKPDIIRQVALACIEWPYVFGAWGEECTPSNRRRRAKSEHPTIVGACQCLRDTNRKASCDGCKWYPSGYRVRMYDCRGFTRWLLQQVGLDIVNGSGVVCQTVSNQYNSRGNWQRRGPINEMPDCVCNVFDLKHGHTGMHIGGGTVIDCSVNVRVSKVSNYTNYAIHKGLYSEKEIPVEIVKPTLRKGDRGDNVKELQEALNRQGFDCGAADGVFGTKTKAAVEAFQRAAGLSVDGVVGRNTWKALGAAEGAVQPPEPIAPQTYRVTVSGATLEQTQRIREICPQAQMEKE